MNIFIAGSNDVPSLLVRGGYIHKVYQEILVER